MANTLSKQKAKDALVLLGSQNGHLVIHAETALRRLHYFDGKFLRAQDLQLEQQSLRRLVAMSNQAGGPGIVHGFDAVHVKGGDRVEISAGLAVDPEGKILHLPQEISLNVAELIEKSRFQPRFAALAGRTRLTPAAFGDCETRAVPEPGDVVSGRDYYLITIGHAEAYCGEEDVYGKLCEEACVTSTERPYIVEGIVVRAVPLRLRTPLKSSQAVTITSRHLQSQAASAYFADEARRTPALISGSGLRFDAWCLGADYTFSRSELPVALLIRSGSVTEVFDVWTVRRERIEPPPRHYWAWKMSMRPWSVFLAQIFQFQCQLTNLFRDKSGPVDRDPCEDEKSAVRDASDAIARLTRYYADVSDKFSRFIELAPNLAEEEIPKYKGGRSELENIQRRLEAAARPFRRIIPQRVLIRGGIVELPSAGYLPVVPGSALTANRQVRTLLGEGVHLRFCVVRPDFVPHALEEAQHMERICLLEGLDRPDAKPEVDILVPDGEISRKAIQPQGTGFEGVLKFAGPLSVGIGTTGLLSRRLRVEERISARTVALRGAGRSEVFASGGGAFHFAGVARNTDKDRVVDFTRGLTGFGVDSLDERFEILRHLAAPDEDGADAGVRLTRAIDPAIYRNVSVLARAANRFIGLRRADSAILRRRLPRIVPRTFEPPEVEAAAATIASWATMRCERNPFEMERGESTPANLKLDLAVIEKTARVSELLLHGSLRVHETGGGPTSRTLRGRFSGVKSMRQLVPGQEPQEQSRILDFDVTLGLRRSSGGKAGLEMTLNAPHSPEIQIQVGWEGNPRDVTGRLDYWFARDKRTTLATTELLENPEVLVAGNSYHTMALGALDIIGAALDDERFADTAARLLFPPPPPPAEELEIKPTLDWVLFHRCRTKKCAVEEQVPLPPPARSYQVYHLQVPDERTALRVREALLTGDDSLAAMDFATIGRVEFAPGIPALTTDPEAVRSDWRRVSPGPVILISAIASQGTAAADGNTVARGRLDRLNNVLATITPLDPEIQTEILARVPAVIEVSGTDGVIVLITIPKFETTKHQVFYVTQPARFLEMLKAEIEARGIVPGSPETHPVFSRLAWFMGTVDFQRGFVDPETESLAGVKEKWEEFAANSFPAGAVVVSKQGDAEPREAQGKALIGVLGAVPPTNMEQIELADQPLPEDAVTLVIPGVSTVCNAVYWFTPEPLKEMPDLATLLAPPEPGRPSFTRQLGTMHFRPGPDAPEIVRVDGALDAENLKAKWQAAALGCPPQDFFVYSKAADPDAGTQAERVAYTRLMAAALNQGNVQPQIREIDNDVPGDCPVITLIRPKTTCHDVWRVVPRDAEEILIVRRAIESRDLKLLVGQFQDSLRNIQFCPGTGQEVFSTLIKLEDARPPAVGKVSDFLIFFREDNPEAGNIESREAQGSVIAGAIGLPEDVEPQQVPVPSQTELPSSCPLLSVVVYNLG